MASIPVPMAMAFVTWRYASLWPPTTASSGLRVTCQLHAELTTTIDSVLNDDETEHRMTDSDDVVVFNQLLTSLPVFTHQPNALKIPYRSWLVYCASRNPRSSDHAPQNLRQVQRRQHPHQATLNLYTEFACHRRDLITMYIVTTIRQFPGLSGLRGLDAFFHARELAINLYYKSRCLHCPIVLALRRTFGIGQRAKDDSNFSGSRVSDSISILLQGLGRSLKGKTQSRNTTTVFTSACTLQAFSLVRCSP